MSLKKTIKFKLDLDTEDFIITFTDREGKKRKFRIVSSEGLVELRTARGKKYLRLMLEEIE